MFHTAASLARLSVWNQPTSHKPYTKKGWSLAQPNDYGWHLWLMSPHLCHSDCRPALNGYERAAVLGNLEKGWFWDVFNSCCHPICVSPDCRPALNGFEIIEQLEKEFGLQSYPITWPIGSGDRFCGVYYRPANKVLLYTRAGRGKGANRYFTFS